MSLESLLLALVVLLLAIALFDLVVGVANDAVNFLTSAVGARAASFRVIMVIASLGVLVGAASSGGMMEIAKRGIFNPSLFTFKSVVFIYVVVMLTDVLLLDFFNSMKLPTSTTISIVFELLGASLAVSFLTVWSQGASLAEWMGYINTAKAAQMILAIFVSVAVAFVAGWVVQYLLRATVTFDYKRYMRLAGSLFGGLVVVVVLNFIIRVGLKSSPLRTSLLVGFIDGHTAGVFLGVFLAAAVGFLLLSLVKGFDVFRVVTLIGTFALAMAFASNDLVNFIGVPVAGYEAFGFWRESGVPADEYMMAVFAGPAGATTTNPFFLYVAGLVMVITLWTSRKARNVIATTVNLSRQDEGVERFQGNELAREVVRFFGFMSGGVSRLVPQSLKDAMERRYRLTAPPEAEDGPPPAFDPVRASVNLIVAASLISLGTALKLPLSTTYVSFMVLMGTSLADRAWNRDSAVYRVSGVFTVIGGWFFTAICALTLSILFASLAYQLGFVGIAIVIGLVVFGLRAIKRFTESQVKLRVSLQLPDEWFVKDLDEIRPHLREKTAEIARAYGQVVGDLTKAVLTEDRDLVGDLQKRLKRQEELNAEYQATLIRQLREVDQLNVGTGHALLDFYLHENDLLEQVGRALRVARLHVLNMHAPLGDDQVEILEGVNGATHAFLEVAQQDPRADPGAVEGRLAELTRRLEEAKRHQVEGLIGQQYSFKNSSLFLAALLRNMNASRAIHGMFEIAWGATSGGSR